jgi:hypothetical protein
MGKILAINVYRTVLVISGCRASKEGCRN